MAYNYNVNGNGQSIEQYNYDEFGIPCFYKDNEVIGLLTRSIQPFGFNGYEMDEVRVIKEKGYLQVKIK